MTISLRALRRCSIFCAFAFVIIFIGNPLEEALAAEISSEQTQQPEEELAQLKSEIRRLIDQGDLEKALPFSQKLVDLTNRISGPQSIELAGANENHGVILVDLNRFLEAVPYFEKNFKIRASLYDEMHPRLLAAVASYAYVLDKAGFPEKARPLLKSNLENRRQVLGDAHEDTIISMENYASVLLEQRDFAQAEPLFQNLISANETVFGANSYEALNAFRNYGIMLVAAGQYKRAAISFRKSSEIGEALFGQEHPETLSSMHLMGSALMQEGSGELALPILAKVVEKRSKILGQDHPETLFSLDNYAGNLMLMGRLAEAKPILADVLARRTAVLGENHPDVIDSLSNYAAILFDLEQYVEAAKLAQEVFQIRAARYGNEHPQTLNSVENYAIVLMKLGNLKDARTLMRTAMGGYLRTYGDLHPKSLAARQIYAVILLEEGLTEDAELQIGFVKEKTVERYGERHPRSIKAMNIEGAILLRLGKFADAEIVLARAFELGKTIPEDFNAGVHRVATNLALTRLNQVDRKHLAYSPAKFAATNVRQRLNRLGYLPKDQDQLLRQEGQRASYFELFANAAWSANSKRSEHLNENELKNEVFLALQDAMMGDTSRAVSEATARRAAKTKGSNVLALVEGRQVLLSDWQENQEKIDRSAVEVGDEVNRQRSLLVERQRSIERQIAQIDKSIRKMVPDYFSLIRPQSLEIQQAKNILRTDEAVLLLVPTDSGTHVFFVSQEIMQWHRSNWDSSQIQNAAKQLLWSAGANFPVTDDEKAIWSKNSDGHEPFLLETAYELYNQLIAPIAKNLDQKRHLFVSSAGSLSNLPLGLLVSEVPEGANGDAEVLRNANWFADDIALIQIPSLQSLNFLRKYRSDQIGEPANPFLGFGDPVLEGESTSRGKTRDGNSQVISGDLRQIFKRGSGTRLADVKALAGLSRLPGTATELTNMWSAFGKPADSLYLADEATEKKFRTSHLDAEVVALATHGIMAGEITGLGEPGLVMTPPERASFEDDGYVSMSEISELKMNTDWVIMSACNTAAGDGSFGSTGLSGLTRSFFYAGARNILASHWPVRDDVAARLTVRTIELKKQNPKLSKAEAFQRAMKELRDDPSFDDDLQSLAHPNAWAPFSLIGDSAN